MTVWLRELAGWILLGVGLAAFAVCYFVFLLQKRVVEAVILGLIGFVVLRSGMHLLKVAIAARSARSAGQPQPAGVTRPIRIGPAASLPPGQPRASVVPGPSGGSSR